MITFLVEYTYFIECWPVWGNDRDCVQIHGAYRADRIILIIQVVSRKSYTFWQRAWPLESSVLSTVFVKFWNILKRTVHLGNSNVVTARTWTIMPTVYRLKSSFWAYLDFFRLWVIWEEIVWLVFWVLSPIVPRKIRYWHLRFRLVLILTDLPLVFAESLSRLLNSIVL